MSPKPRRFASSHVYHDTYANKIVNNPDGGRLITCDDQPKPP
jgi:hypothetical protein